MWFSKKCESTEAMSSGSKKTWKRVEILMEPVMTKSW